MGHHNQPQCRTTHRAVDRDDLLEETQGLFARLRTGRIPDVYGYGRASRDRDGKGLESNRLCPRRCRRQDDDQA